MWGSGEQLWVELKGKMCFPFQPQRLNLSLVLLPIAKIAATHLKTSLKLSLLSIGFTCGSAGKESAWNAGDLGLIPGWGRSSREGKGYPFQYSGLGNSMDCIVHGVAKSQTWLSEFYFTSLHFTSLHFTSPVRRQPSLSFWVGVCNEEHHF